MINKALDTSKAEQTCAASDPLVNSGSLISSKRRMVFLTA